jgi:hypothetical protein
VLKPAGAAVTVPWSVVLIVPVWLVARTVGSIVAAEFEVNVNVKPPIVTAQLPTIGPATTEMVTGVKLTGVPVGRFKFPVDPGATTAEGLTRVFAVVVEAIRAEAGTKAENTGLKPTLPEGSIAAYAVLLSSATINPAAPASFAPNFLMS